jgi:hypothetical protein
MAEVEGIGREGEGWGWLLAGPRYSVYLLYLTSTKVQILTAEEVRGRSQCMGEEMREGSERSVTSTRPASGGLRPRLPGIHCPLSKLSNHAFVVQITKLYALNYMLQIACLKIGCFPSVLTLSRCFGRNVSAKLEERRAVLRERERERERSVPFFLFPFLFPFFPLNGSAKLEERRAALREREREREK